MKRKNSLLSVSIIFILAFTFVFAACNIIGGIDDDLDNVLPNIDLSDDMTVDEIKEALSEVKNYTFTYKEKETICEETYFVDQNGYLIDYIDLENTYYIANFIADENSAYYLIRNFNGTEETSHTYNHYTNVSDQFDEAKKEINKFIKEYLNDYYNEVEKNDATMTVKDGELVFEGANWICTFYDFNKTTLPIDEFFPGYKETAVEYVDDDDDGNIDDGGNNDDNNDNNGDDNGEEDVLFVSGMSLAEIKATLSTVDSYTWVKNESEIVLKTCENGCFYSEIDAEEEVGCYCAIFSEDNKWYSLYRDVEGTNEDIDYSWSETDDAYNDFLESDAATMVETLLEAVENGNASLAIENDVITIVYRDDTYTIYDFNETTLPIDEYFPGYKELAVKQTDDTEDGNNNDDDGNEDVIFTDGMTLDEVKAVLSEVKNYKMTIGESINYIIETGYAYTNVDGEYSWQGAWFIEDGKIYNLSMDYKNSVETDHKYYWKTADADGIAEIKDTFGINFILAQLGMVEDGDCTLTVENGKIILTDVAGDDQDSYVFYDFNKTTLPIDEYFPGYKDVATENVETE